MLRKPVVLGIEEPICNHVPELVRHGDDRLQIGGLSGAMTCVEVLYVLYEKHGRPALLNVSEDPLARLASLPRERRNASRRRIPVQRAYGVALHTDDPQVAIWERNRLPCQ